MNDTVHDLLVVGAGPTGIAIGAEARRAGLDVLLLDRGALCNAILNFPTNMQFFTTRDLLEIADIPFSIPEAKPSRQQAMLYYQGVVRHYGLPLALYEDVQRVERGADGLFTVTTRRRGLETRRRARAVALATGYYDQPNKLGVPGEDLPWVSPRYYEPYPHFGQRVVVVGGGNSACETALDLWRNHAEVTLVHYRAELRPTVKYWVKPDAENRIAEGSIQGYFNSHVREFRDGEVVIERDGEEIVIPADAAYVMIGYRIDAAFERRCGVELDAETLVPVYDPETCESNVPGLYVAGTLRAGHKTNKIFIENAREDAPKIVGALVEKLKKDREPALVG